MGRAEKRQRYQFKFWLDCAKDDELLLAEEADELKRRRSWQPTIRDALRLILDLRNHKTEALLSFFPWIEDYFRAKFAIQDSPANVEFAAILRQQADILAQLAQRHAVTALPAPAGSLPELLPLPSIFANDAPQNPSEARANFAAGMGNLFADDDDDF